MTTYLVLVFDDEEFKNLRKIVELIASVDVVFFKSARWRVMSCVGIKCLICVKCK